MDNTFPTAATEFLEQWVYGVNRVTLETWKDINSLGASLGSDWESTVDAEIQKIDQPTAALEFLERMRAAAKGN